jgi:hypothetical protein
MKKPIKAWMMINPPQLKKGNPLILWVKPSKVEIKSSSEYGFKIIPVLITPLAQSPNLTEQ